MEGLMKRIFILCILVGLVFAQPLIRIDYSELDKLTADGYDIAYVRRGAYIDIVGWSKDIQRLKQNGIQYEIIIDDLPKYYSNRLDKSLDMGGYRTYDEIVQWMDSIHTLYPDIVSERDSVAAGWDSHILWTIKVSDNVDTDEDEPEVLYDAGIHAREVITPEVLMHFVEWLCQNYSTNPIATYIVNERELWFIPLMNPDGYVVNETYNPDGGGMWRKNTRDNNEDEVFDTLDDGVDLNRNFGFMWGTGGSSSNPSEATYMGPDSFSEPEIQGYRDFVLSRNFRTNLTYHSFSNYYLFPWGYTDEYCEHHYYFMLFTDWMAERNGYVHGNTYDVIYQASGTTSDWMYGVLGIFSISPEVGGWEDGFWPPTERIEPLCQENMLANIVIALVAGVAPRVSDFSITEFMGDYDGYPDVGERISITPLVRNYGIDSVSEVSVIINPISDGLIAVTETAEIFESIAPQGDTASSENLLIDIMPPVNPGDIVQFELLAITSDGYWIPDTFSFVVGTPVSAYSQDFDDTYSGWILDGDWEIGIPTVGPTPHSEPAVLATRLSADYSNNTVSEVISPKYYIDTEWYSPTLSFWHWYNTEWDGSYYYDGGQVQIWTSTTGWTILTPETGYPAVIYDGNPYLTEQPGFSGTQRNWTQVQFDLSAYADDTVQFKFIFASDPYVKMEGWYIDDFTIGGYEPETSAVIINSPKKPEKIGIYISPNPFNASCEITIGHNYTDKQILEIVDITGKVVERFFIPTGEKRNSVIWNAENIPSGIYFVRFDDSVISNHRMLLIR